MPSAPIRAEPPAPPVRVCFVIENLLSAGTELWVVRLIERLDRRLVTPLLCLTDGQAGSSRRLEPLDCEVLRLGLSQLKTPRTLAAARRLYRFLRQHKVEIVQVHHADPSYLGVPVARLAGVPAIVQTKYDIGYWLTGADRWLHRSMRRWIDVTVSNCQACRDAAIQQEHAPPASVVVIDNGIDTSRLVQIDSLTPRDWQAALHVGMVANLRPIKDPGNLVQAARHLIREGCSATFHLAGQGPLQEALQAEIQREGLQERIVLHGHVSDPATFISTLQIFVLCSLSEGLPHALLEAMAAGRAVIATDVGGNRELIQDQVNGLLIPPANPRALADAIGRLVADPELALRLAQTARRSVADRFSLPAMTQRFTDFYRSLRRPVSSPEKATVRPADRSAQPTTASLGEFR